MKLKPRYVIEYTLMDGTYGMYFIYRRLRGSLSKIAKNERERLTELHGPLQSVGCYDYSYWKTT
jgi:hypothetical protein